MKQVIMQLQVPQLTEHIGMIIMLLTLTLIYYFKIVVHGQHIPTMYNLVLQHQHYKVMDQVV